MQKLKGFTSSTKLSTIGITTLAIMATNNNHVNGLHSLQDLKDKTMDLVRSFFLHFFIYVFCYNETMNDVDVFLPCFFYGVVPLLEEKGLFLFKEGGFSPLATITVDVV